MEFRILGPLEVTQGNRALALGGAKQRALLAILVIHASRVVSTDRLIDLLWGDDAPPTAGNTLQVYVSQLRKALEPTRTRRGPAQVLVRRAPGYVLEVDEDAIDACRFERLVEIGRDALAASDHERAAEVLRTALALWRGPALADFSYEPFAQSEITRLEELRMAALEDRIAADLALGRHASFVGELDALVAQYPLREGLRGHLMLALYRSGRQAEALQVYQDTRRALEGELGIDPSSALQQLEKGILLQDASLAAPARAEFRRPAVPEGESEPDPGPAAHKGGEPLMVRKIVTVLSCEMFVHSPDGTELDPETVQRVSARLGKAARAILERHGGTPAQSFADHIVGAFGVPFLHEDDALRATTSALEMQQSLAASAAEHGRATVALEIGIGINTGEVVVDSTAPAGALPTGEAINRAVRLGRAAGPGEILLSATTHHLTADAVEVEEVAPARAPGVNGLPVFRVVAARPGVAGRARQLGAPMVGRDFERAQMMHAYERAARGQSCHLFTVLGPAGVGKSRLVSEVTAALEGQALVLMGRCLPYGEGVTLAPVSEMIGQATAIEGRSSVEESVAQIRGLVGSGKDAERIAERLGELCGLAEGLGTVEETFWAVRKLFESMSRRRPVVAVFDDVHWAEPMLLDLIEHIADWLRDSPVFLVAIARPEFLEVRPSWAGGKLNASSTLLDPLSEEECRLIVCNLLGEKDAGRSITARIVEAAEGNPLYVEEMTRMLVDEGHLRLTDGHWTAATDLSSITVPPTIHALIAARLDRLGSEERQVIEHAAVVGRVFSRRALAELCSEPVAGRLGTHLETLMRKELIRPDRSDADEDEAYRFRHMLIRDAAYAEVAKSRRSELHERIAAFLDVDEGAAAREETRGYHLERAFEYRMELDPNDPANEDVGRRAARLLTSAGHRAWARGDLEAAAHLFERATRLLPDDGPARLETALDLSGCLIEVGDLAGSETAVAAVSDRAAALGDRRLAARAAVQLWELRSSSENLQGWKEEAARDADEAVAVFEPSNDELGLAKAFFLRAMIHQVDYEFGRADVALERALEHARRSGREQEEARIFYAYTMSALWGPTHVDDAIRRHHDFMLRFSDNRLVEANCLRGLAALEAMKGRFTTARELLSKSKEILNDLGATLVASTSLVPGIVELLAGDAREAERRFRSSYAALKRAGERNARATAAAYVARALYAQGRVEEAERFTLISEELAPADDHAARVEWSTTRAKVLAVGGRYEEAERLAVRAAALAGLMDDIETHAQALRDRAEVLRLAGRSAEAENLVRSAIDLHEHKGNVVSAAQARAFLEELRVAAS
jgi:DNA-binding SARP family transcriptional activator/class 3 adenylate cyclase